MNSFRPAVAVLISALASPALSQSTATTPLSTGPTSSMDPTSENALVGLGQRAVLTLGDDAAQRIAAEKKAAPPPKAADDSDAPESETDLAALGRQIINPPAPSTPSPGAAGMNPAASPSQSAAADAEQAPASSGLTYTHLQKVEATLGKKEAAASETLLNDGQTAPP